MGKCIFVTGGTGFVGTNIIQSLLDNGYDVKVLSKGDLNGNFPQNVDVIKGDILEPDSWKNSVDGCDIFINLIGIIREVKSKNITFEKLHIEASKNVISLCKAYGIKRLLHMSAAGATYNGVSRYLTTKFEAEELVMASNINYTIFRPSMIFGSEDKNINFFASIIKSIGVFPIFGKGDYLLQPVYVKNVAEVFVKSINNPACYNKTFCVGGEDIFEYKNLIKIISKSINENPILPHIPVSIARILTSIMGRFQFYPLTRDQLEMLLIGNTCENSDVFNILNINRKSLKVYLCEHFKKNKK